MVGGHDHHRLLPLARFLQILDEPTDLDVGHEHGGVGSRGVRPRRVLDGVDVAEIHEREVRILGGRELDHEIHDAVVERNARAARGLGRAVARTDLGQIERAAQEIGPHVGDGHALGIGRDVDGARAVGLGAIEQRAQLRLAEHGRRLELRPLAAQDVEERVHADQLRPIERDFLVRGPVVGAVRDDSVHRSEGARHHRGVVRVGLRHHHRAGCAIHGGVCRRVGRNRAGTVDQVAQIRRLGGGDVLGNHPVDHHHEYVQARLEQRVDRLAVLAQQARLGCSRIVAGTAAVQIPRGRVRRDAEHLRDRGCEVDVADLERRLLGRIERGTARGTPGDEQRRAALGHVERSMPAARRLLGEIARGRRHEVEVGCIAVVEDGREALVGIGIGRVLGRNEGTLYAGLGRGLALEH